MFNQGNAERGIALFMSLIILLLLSALALSLIYMANTDTFVSANYRSQQVLYFAAKAGVEEGRNRLMVANGANSIVSPNCAGGAAACLPATPVVPSDVNRGVLYILGGSNPAVVKPWVAGSIYTDDELCHDGYSLTGQTPHSADVHCTDVPTGASWYATTNSIAPWSGSTAAMPYQWVRVSLKLNGSVDNGRYKVNTNALLGPTAPNTPVCWDGKKEIVLPAGAANCTVIPNIPANPVFLITALAVNTQSQSRRMVQSEVALNPQPPFPYGMFATSTDCGALKLGSAETDSYTSANGSNYASSHTNSGGDIGSNANVLLDGNTTINGDVGVPDDTVGPCPAGLTTNGGKNTYSSLTKAGPYTFTTPPPPVPMPPKTDEPKIGKTGANLLPGTYGNISVTAGGTIKVAPGTYNINSISLAGGSTLLITPSGSVVFNVAGVGQATPIDFSGGSIQNDSLIANNFLVNYGGTDTVKLTGNVNSYVTVYAPNAAVEIEGGSELYGAVIGYTVKTMGNNTKFHYDRNTSVGPQSNGYYTQVAVRDIQY